MEKSQIYVYGHKNPDTDSICSAIGLAYLKNQMSKEHRCDVTKHFGLVEDGEYIPRAAGEPNDETAYVLKRFGVEKPEVVKDIRVRVSDLKIKEAFTVSGDISIRRAWETMDEQGIKTLIVRDDSDKIRGLITLKDIANAYVSDSRGDRNKAEGDRFVVRRENLLDAIDGNELTAVESEKICINSVNIMAADITLADRVIKENGFIITDYSKEKIEYLINKKVGTIVLCHNQKPDEALIDMANDTGVTIISSKNDIYEIARLINQSISVETFMVDERDVIKFVLDEFVDDIKNIMLEKRVREFPVITHDRKIRGLVDKASLIEVNSQKIALVDHNESTQAVFGLADHEVVEIVDHHKLSTIETNRPINVTSKQVGCTGTIVCQMFEDAGIEIPKHIAGVLSGAILSDTMFFKSPTCTDEDVRAAKKLENILGQKLEDIWNGMLDASLNFEDKSDEEILYQDYKKFSHGGFGFGIGQVLVANDSDVAKLKERIRPYMNSEFKGAGVDMMGLLITDVSTDSSDLIFCGDTGRGLVESAFDREVTGDSVFLEGVVSRKKQIVPQLLNVLER